MASATFALSRMRIGVGSCQRPRATIERVTTTSSHSAVTPGAPHDLRPEAAAVSAPSLAVKTQATSAVATVPSGLTTWKDAAAAVQSSVTVLGIIAGAVWFLRRRQRFPRANVTHDVKYWFVDGRVILHTVVRVQNIGEVMLRLTGVNIRAQQLLPTPDEPLQALLSGRDPVKAGETEILRPSVCERSCDWSRLATRSNPVRLKRFISIWCCPVLFAPSRCTRTSKTT